MEKILIITDDAYDTYVTDFAYTFALQNNKDLIIAHTTKPQAGVFNRQLVANYNSRLHRQHAHVMDYGNEGVETLRRVKIIDVCGVTEREIADYVRKEDCSMIISRAQLQGLNLQTILNQVSCPLMLLPENFITAELNRIVYLTDLRYCQLPVVSFLSKLKGTSLLLAHICQQGLPDLTIKYGNELFKDAIAPYLKTSELFFSHIKEKNMRQVVDTLVNTMRADILACVNRRFHFQQLFGDYLPKSAPDYISVPVLIFPC